MMNYNSILDSIRSDYIKQYQDCSPNDDILYRYFIERVRNNLHIVFCMSPIGKLFIDSIRLYPSLVNCATIKWFNDWPQTALKEVAYHFLKDISTELTDGGNNNYKQIMDIIPSIFCYSHTCSIKMSQKMAINDKRFTYITPTNYLSLVIEYTKLLKLKKKLNYQQIN